VAQILWLASYPKSGNTWVRAFMANFIANKERPLNINELRGYADGDMASWPYERVFGGDVFEVPFDDLYKQRGKAHRLLAQSRPGVLIVKTHNRMGLVQDVPIMTPDVTWGGVYVIRNPLDIIPSYADHYGCSIETAIMASLAEDHKLGRMKTRIDQYVGSWTSHVRSWMIVKGLHRHVMRYEDILDNPQKSFSTMISFLEMPSDRNRIKKAAKFSSFKTLRSQEDKEGFTERSANSKRFFRTGRAGGWENTLSEEQIALICRGHRHVMRAFGYLDDNDQLLRKPRPIADMSVAIAAAAAAPEP